MILMISKNFFFMTTQSHELPCTVTISCPNPIYALPPSLLKVCTTLTNIITTTCASYRSLLEARLSKSLTGNPPYRYITPTPTNLSPEFLHHISRGRIIFAGYAVNTIPTLNTLPEAVLNAVSWAYFTRTNISLRHSANAFGENMWIRPSRFGYDQEFYYSLRFLRPFMPDILSLKLPNLQKISMGIPRAYNNTRHHHHHHHHHHHYNRNNHNNSINNSTNNNNNNNNNHNNTTTTTTQQSITPDALIWLFHKFRTQEISSFEIIYENDKSTWMTPRDGSTRSLDDVGFSCVDWEPLTRTRGAYTSFIGGGDTSYFWIPSYTLGPRFITGTRMYGLLLKMTKLKEKELAKRGRYVRNWDPKEEREEEVLEEAVVWKVQNSTAGQENKVVEMLVMEPRKVSWQQNAEGGSGSGNGSNQRVPAYTCWCRDCGGRRPDGL
ncbi:hypothetical protein TWF730_000258 [Orbilia blumenaviensis]|uniref:Uncharacterized protein n=1 Tax=Orbilia blumenaviensis TaxID=1796055 RepID=A0AAV9VS64_9PEZI